MARFILTRIGYMGLVLFVVVSITFFLIHSIPGDPITAMVQDLPAETRANYLAKYGFDQPLHIQYFMFLKQLLRGDLGQSLRYPGRQVLDIATNYAPVSAKIGGLSLGVGFAIGIVLGIIAALNRNRWSDRAVMIVALLGTTIPVFTVAAVLQYLLTVHWRLFPTTGWGTAKHLVLPMLCMCARPIASYARYMRSSVLDVTGQDYILTAEAKGLTEFQIVTRHVLRNSFLPCITMICTSIAALVSGSFIVETIFAIPGLGRYFITAINDRDYSIVLGLNIIFTGVYVLSMLATDILLMWLDPRIRLAGNE